MKKSVSILLSILFIILMITTTIPFVSAQTTLIDENKKVSLTVSCNKTGYTFEVFQVATLSSTTSSTYETKYTSLVPEISDSIIAGDTSVALAALDELTDLSTTSAVSKGLFISENNTKTFSDLEHGIYYVKAIEYPAGVKSVTNSLVALPYYNNGWIYEIDTINLAEKVQEDTPTIVKTITNSTKNNVNYTDVSLGDKIDFSICSATAGSSSMKLSSYVVYDDMAAGLSLDKNSFVVSLLNSNKEKIDTLTTSEYNVNYTKENAGENTQFNISLTTDYLSQDEFYLADYISVVYSATLNQYSVVGEVGNKNTATELVYANKNGTESSVSGNDVYVYSFGIKVNKIDDYNKPLSGAEFEIYQTEDNAKKKENSIAKGTSDENGVVLFYNTANEEIRLASGTYYLRETKAPTDFNIYSKVITVEIEAEYGNVLTNNTYITKAPENGYVSIDVLNTKSFLPVTGGLGDYNIYIIGGIVMAIGILLFVVAIRKSKREEK